MTEFRVDPEDLDEFGRGASASAGSAGRGAGGARVLGHGGTRWRAPCRRYPGRSIRVADGRADQAVGSMRGPRTALLGASLIALAVSAVISGCSTAAVEERNHELDHHRAKAEVDSLYTQTLAIVGDGWNPPSSEEWRGCGRTSMAGENESWSRFTQRFGQLDETPQRLAEKVAELWTKLGYPVHVVSDDRMSPPREVVSYPAYLTGTTQDGFGAVFTVGDGYADFSAGSRCVPIDLDQESSSS
ncbi:hypothetical protein IT072_01085 [Leifsonia sp. ZF2019]|uniref:hypothetical protein n=1 Tax=Leifsonia sp. ZF2019 TaxID=2781978 RepID=UPI001CBE6CDE|nr:hypothetical protein [Leifsonia sp. ZF2019]UAJ79725.1 hypothetical protein IT072_01085 [Leifsonia sp. ZF2019]